ncbi:shikimate dehydrogenase family protein [Halomonas sp. V046]|uniref:shikimate dehydrogenase family protein n=1 Tax=Halomonas sp. V046 TaxID=3459611 RepID=UPI00404397BD
MNKPTTPMSTTTPGTRPPDQGGAQGRHPAPGHGVGLDDADERRHSQGAPTSLLGGLDGSSRLYLILGDPIAQVKSPQGVTQALQQRGHNAVLAPAHVAAQDLHGFVRGVVAAENLDGLIITVPHKLASYSLCDSASERATFLGAVNVMRRTGNGGWHGDQVDGLAYVAAMRAKGLVPTGRRALLAGAGGAGSAIAEALVRAGVASLSIHDGDAERRDGLIARLASLGLCPVTVGGDDPAGFDLVINATPCGMATDDPLPFDPAGLSAGTIVGDVITSPELTPWIAAARERHCPTLQGGEMFACVRDLMVDFLLETPAVTN